MANRSLLFIILLFSAFASAETSEKFKWLGDIRLRGQIEKKGDDEVRPSQRLRIRFGVGVDVQKDLRAEIRLATATGNRSTNQSLGDGNEPGSKRRAFGLDLAYGK